MCLGPKNALKALRRARSHALSISIDLKLICSQSSIHACGREDGTHYLTGCPARLWVCERWPGTATDEAADFLRDLLRDGSAPSGVPEIWNEPHRESDASQNALHLMQSWRSLMNAVRAIDRSRDVCSPRHLGDCA